MKSNKIKSLKGLDGSYYGISLAGNITLKTIDNDLDIKELTNLDVTSKLQENDIHCEMKSQPNFPVLDLRIDEQSYVFNSLYRVWMIESIFSNVLEHRYKSESNTDSELK